MQPDLISKRWLASIHSVYTVFSAIFSVCKYFSKLAKGAKEWQHHKYPIASTLKAGIKIKLITSFPLAIHPLPSSLCENPKVVLVRYPIHGVLLEGGLSKKYLPLSYSKNFGDANYFLENFLHF